MLVGYLLSWDSYKHATAIEGRVRLGSYGFFCLIQVEDRVL